MVGTLCLSGAAIIKAGENVSSSVPDAAWDDYIEEAEGYLSTITKYDLVGNWGTLSGSSAAPMMEEYCARSAATQGIAYNMAGFTTIVEAEDMINLHIYRMEKIEEILGIADIQDFIGV